MADKTDAQIRLLRMLILLLMLVAVASAAVHFAIQGRLDSVPAVNAPSMYALLSVQTWLQATIVGGLLVLIGYFVLLPVARRIDENERALREKEAALDHARRHDQLTGFPDRRTFEQLLEHSTEVGRRHNHAVGLLRIRLTGLRSARSQGDFSAADALVAAVAGRIADTIRAADQPARLGDHEFALVVSRIKSVDGLGRLAERLIEEIGETIGEDSQKSGVGCLIGIAVAWPSEREPAGALLERSAEALEEASGPDGSAWRYHASAIQGMTRGLRATA